MWPGCEAGYALRWKHIAERSGRTSDCAPRSYGSNQCCGRRIGPRTGMPAIPLRRSSRESCIILVATRCTAIGTTARVWQQKPPAIQLPRHQDTTGAQLHICSGVCPLAISSH